MTNLNLMVGDYINHFLSNNKDPYFKVKEILADKIVTTTLIYGANVEIDNNLIQPIPLSPESMEKIGFVKNDKIVGSWDLELFRFHTQRPYSVEDFTSVTECYYAERDLFIHGGLKHLHQLQQLIRLFTGKEIVVKWE